MKQISWWKSECDKHDVDNPQKYSKDWIAALLIHSFVWAFITFYPLLLLYDNKSGIIFILLLQMIIHAFIDHIKCNLYKINLFQDQFLHLIQITLTILYCL